MAISTYSELKISVASWLHRADLAALIPDFIALAESKIATDLETRDMESRTSLSCTAGDAYVSLPPDMLEMRRLCLSSIEPAKPLLYRSPDELQADYPYSFSGRPAVFAVIGSQIQLAPIPDDGYTLELSYVRSVPALSDSNPTNWLLTKWPGIYLYGALCAAQPYIMNDERASMFQALYKEAVEGANLIDWYSGPTMRVKAK